MADQYTSETGKKLFKVRLEPEGQVLWVYGSNSIEVNGMVPGLVAHYQSEGKIERYNGSHDVNPATQEEIITFLEAGSSEEE